MFPFLPLAVHSLCARPFPSSSLLIDREDRSHEGQPWVLQHALPKTCPFSPAPLLGRDAKCQPL